MSYITLVLYWILTALLMACSNHTVEQACDQFLSLCIEELPTDIIETSRDTCIESLEATDDDDLNECLVQSSTCEDTITCGYLF